MTEESCKRQKMGMTNNCALCKELNSEAYESCKSSLRMW